MMSPPCLSTSKMLFKNGTHGMEPGTTISVVAETATVILHLHRDPTGMAYVYLHWSNLDQCNYRKNPYLDSEWHD